MTQTPWEIENVYTLTLANSILLLSLSLAIYHMRESLNISRHLAIVISIFIIILDIFLSFIALIPYITRQKKIFSKEEKVYKWTYIIWNIAWIIVQIIICICICKK